MSEKPNCFECTHRGKVPGSTHSCCNHPNASKLEVVGKQYGIDSGWFFFPYNFDPCWLQECNGFESKDEAIA